jgi:hypothetical protein
LNLIELRGKYLKISSKNPETGIVLINTKDKSRFPQRVLVLTQNNKIQFQLSNLPKGNYIVEVTSIIGKTIRTTRYDGKIQVENSRRQNL